jgi:hypothetical protein
VTPNRLLLGLVATCGLVGVAVAGVWAAQEFSIGRGESSTVAAAPTDTGSGSDSVVPETVELESAEPEPEPEREPGPVDPEILAAHQDGSMVDLGGLFFDNAGTDPLVRTYSLTRVNIRSTQKISRLGHGSLGRRPR